MVEEALQTEWGEPLDFSLEISCSFMLMVPRVTFLSYPGALDVDKMVPKRVMHMQSTDFFFVIKKNSSFFSNLCVLPGVGKGITKYMAWVPLH